ncbi:hypothetical protein INS49_007384 [Diaporthe citri]|uniref:uncharacterized protein n=1 Tax=Diaporthe citri TaxID=83186 RepID=UPI001C81DFB7|nr:uncharacterized protein INS49_007384 [Diaporthe citri]KAG6365773.1 hypothetical protein INS49_007384 [Diaporthe citri]
MNPRDSDGGTVAFSPIEYNDHAGYLWIVTILGIIYSSFSGLARARIKKGIYGADDYLIGLATLLLYAQSAVIFQGLKNGLAKSEAITSEDRWPIAGKTFLASEILSITILCLAKCSVASLVRRVFTFDIDKTWITCMGVLTFSAVWGLGSVVGLAVNCDSGTTLTTSHPRYCPEQFLRWQIITAFDIITEILICFLPVVFVWSNTMSLCLKFQVFLAFAFRLPLIALSVAHLSLFEQYIKSASPLFEISGSLLLQQVTLTYSLISATIPNLKSFMKSQAEK